MLEICSVSTQVCERRQTGERMILQCIKLTVNDDFTFTLTKEKYHSSFHRDMLRGMRHPVVGTLCGEGFILQQDNGPKTPQSHIMDVSLLHTETLSDHAGTSMPVRF